MTPAIELRGLTKDFATGLRGLRLRAVDNLSLRIEAGQVYGLLGPNGSGKSTTLKVLLGLLAPTAGTCSIFGHSSGQVEARRRMGYLPESPYFYRFLTGRELVAFYGQVCGLRGPGLRVRVREAIAWVGLDEAADRLVETYSKGMLQRIGLAQALVHDPELVILDEPTAGVDPAGAAAMMEMILKLKASGKTVLITSHLLGQIEDVCDRVAMLDHGRLVLEGGVGELTRDDRRVALVMDELSAGELAELRAWLGARGRMITSVDRPRTRLEQVFLRRVGPRAAGAGKERA
jgi:ABC-2 type transport system ATP-binding protein